MLKMMEVKWASLFVCLLLVAHCSSASVKQTARYASLPFTLPFVCCLLYITPHYFSSLNVMIYHEYHTFIIRSYCCIRSLSLLSLAIPLPLHCSSRYSPLFCPHHTYLPPLFIHLIFHITSSQISKPSLTNVLLLNFYYSHSSLNLY